MLIYFMKLHKTCYKFITRFMFSQNLSMKNSADQDDLVFKALAGADRRKILDLLRQAPLTTGNICQQLHWLNRCTVMQHIKVLAGASLIISKKTMVRKLK